MKRVVIIVVLLTLVLGCQKDDKSTKIDINLAGNPSTGYEWNCNDDANIVKIDREYESSNSNLSGSGGTYTFTLTGLKEGNTIVKCIYKRSWEENEDDEIKEYQIKIDKNLKISMKEM